MGRIGAVCASSGISAGIGCSSSVIWAIAGSNGFGSHSAQANRKINKLLININFNMIFFINLLLF
jgi:hypothetical protein